MVLRTGALFAKGGRGCIGWMGILPVHDAALVILWRAGLCGCLFTLMVMVGGLSIWLIGGFLITAL